MASTSSSRRSPVWDHFERIAEKKVKCKLCISTTTVLAYHGGTTCMSMQNHLAGRHPNQYRTAAGSSKKNRTMDEFVSSKCSTARSKEISSRIARGICTL